MSKPDSDNPLPVGDKATQLATTGLTLSAIGFVGWIIVLIAMLAIPHEQYSGDGQRDLVIGLGNFMAYILRVLIGLVGLSINGTLSLVGTVISASALGISPTPKSQSGLALGIIGILIGVALVIWRMSVWGVISA